MYRLFDGAVSCDFPLTGVPESPAREADIQVTLGSGLPDETGYDWFHAWRETDGELVLACARHTAKDGATGYLLRFPELADFMIQGKVVTCYPGPDCRDDSLRHLVLDQLIPRLWAHRGHLVLHASAVQIPDGRVVAFLGESGWGKSTLAAALQLRGCHLLSDDSISLKVAGGRVLLVPSYTGLRLNDDSIATLGMAGEGWTSVCHYSDKRRMAPAASAAPEPPWLDTLYLMREPGEARELLVEPIAGVEAITTLIKRSFLLDINDTRCAARQMHEAGAAVRSLPHVCSLDYPRDYRQLPMLCDALLAGGTG